MNKKSAETGRSTIGQADTYVFVSMDNGVFAGARWRSCFEAMRCRAEERSRREMTMTRYRTSGISPRGRGCCISTEQVWLWAISGCVCSSESGRQEENRARLQGLRGGEHSAPCLSNPPTTRVGQRPELSRNFDQFAIPTPFLRPPLFAPSLFSCRRASKTSWFQDANPTTRILPNRPQSAHRRLRLPRARAPCPPHRQTQTLLPHRCLQPSK